MALVLNTMAEMGLRGEEGVRESILIRGGSYCGRKFETAHGHAIWFLEENQVKFYAEGTLVKVCRIAAAASSLGARRCRATGLAIFDWDFVEAKYGFAKPTKNVCAAACASLFAFRIDGQFGDAPPYQTIQRVPTAPAGECKCGTVRPMLCPFRAARWVFWERSEILTLAALVWRGARTYTQWSRW
ncbi:MAG: hypothetical protein U0894_01635 [Pirellulales bacterium]